MAEKNKWVKDSGERFVMKGPGIIGKKGQISRMAAEEGEKHFAELEKQWGVKFEPYPLPGDPDYDENKL